MLWDKHAGRSQVEETGIVKDSATDSLTMLYTISNSIGDVKRQLFSQKGNYIDQEEHRDCTTSECEKSCLSKASKQANNK